MLRRSQPLTIIGHRSKAHVDMPAGSRYKGGGSWRKVYIDFWFREMYEKHFSELFSHAVFGYTMRLLLFTSVCTVSFLTARRLLYWSEEGKPLSQRKFQRYVPVTFIDRTLEGGKDSSVYIYRFALPNSFDYTGHQCFSSCEINLKNAWIRPVKRYYTPINHPEQRGIIEFAIKHYTPGEMSTQLRTFEPGETVHIGGWLKEMKYEPNKYDEIGFIAANSGITPFLQMLTCALADPEDKTKFSLLFANDTPESIPFQKKLEAVRERFPERVKVNFVVTRTGAKGTTGEGVEVVLTRASKALKDLGRPKDGLAQALQIQHQQEKEAELLKLKQQEQEQQQLVTTTGAVVGTSNLASVSSSISSNQQQESSSSSSSSSIRANTSLLEYDETQVDPRTGDPLAKAIKTKNYPGYEGYQGFVDRDLILEHMPLPTEKESSKILVCGPSKFMSNLCGRSLPVGRITYAQGMFDGIMRRMGYERGQLYKFSYSWHHFGYEN